MLGSIYHWDLYRNLNTRPLSWMNYSWRCKLLLHLEELQVMREIEKYNQNDVQLSRHEGNLDILILKVMCIIRTLKLKNYL